LTCNIGINVNAAMTTGTRNIAFFYRRKVFQVYRLAGTLMMVHIIKCYLYTLVLHTETNIWWHYIMHAVR
ncbi:hypothetical protein ACJX0J_041049, partial [Zea mays]